MSEQKNDPRATRSGAISFWHFVQCLMGGGNSIHFKNRSLSFTSAQITPTMNPPTAMPLPPM